MHKSKDKLAGWVSLILIGLYLGGCAKSEYNLDLPPIYVVQSDIQCMAQQTKRQIVKHNCKVDYDATYCNFQEKN
jgi:hypothetical protein